MDPDTGRKNDDVDERPVEGPGVPALPLVLLVRLYQVTLGVAMGGHCRFQPSCSQYAIEALTVHGALRGSWLTVRRLSRCHPFGGSGYDPVPPNNARPVATDDTEHHVEAERG